MIENSSARPAPLQVPCPACRKKVTWSSDNTHRPFCSERCKTSDFIAWANEEQVIPGHEPITQSLPS